MVSKFQKIVFRKYYLRCFLILICYIAVAVPCIYFCSDIWSIVICTVLYLPVKILIRIVANKTISSILFSKLDAKGFQELIRYKKFLPPLTYRINAARFTGDYQTVVNIATAQIQKKKCSIRSKYYYLSILAATYFELRDFEKVKILLKKHDEYIARYPSKSFLRTPNSIWSYYRYFFEHNYEACKVLCNERYLALNPKVWDAKISKLWIDFLMAVACYEDGDFGDAKEIFEGIISSAPKMNAAKLSQKYLVAIEQKQQTSLKNVAVLPESDFQMHDAETAAKIRRYKLVNKILIPVLVVLVIVCSVFSAMYEEKNRNIYIFEKNLNQAVIQQYQDATVIDYFNLYKGERFINALVLIAENDSIHLAEIVSYGNDQTMGISLLKENIILHKNYCVRSFLTNYEYGFVLSQRNTANTDVYCVREFKINKDDCYFIVDYIEYSQ